MNKLSLIFSVAMTLLSSQDIQTEWATDTIAVALKDSVINLSHEMVVENTITDLSGTISKEDYFLNSLMGKLVLNDRK